VYRKIGLTWSNLSKSSKAEVEFYLMLPPSFIQKIRGLGDGGAVTNDENSADDSVDGNYGSEVKYHNDCMNEFKDELQNFFEC
jgi:hypothetical protein